MTILSRVCAEFTDARHRTILSVKPDQLNCVLTDVPEEIQLDPLFSMLLADGSLEAVQSVSRKKALENDPLAGITAEGKKAGRVRKAPASAPREKEAGAEPPASPDAGEAPGPAEKA